MLERAIRSAVVAAPLAVVLLLARSPAGSGSSAPPAGELARAGDLPAALAPAGPKGPAAPARQTAPGTIEGRLELTLPAPRRSPARYPGRGAAASTPVQRLPAVVYLRGPTSAPAAAPRVMAQQDTAFAPGVLVVPVGTTVDFPNRDPFFHNVFSYSSPARFDLGRYPAGESKSVTFDEPGVVKLYCEVHEHMRGAIVVAGSHHHALLDGSGDFTIPDVPAGRWTVVAWHADLGSTETEVVVPDGAEARVELELGGRERP